MDNFRTLIFEQQFESDFEQLEPDARRRQEFSEGFDGFFSRCPEKGSQIPDSHVWIKEIPDIPKRRRLSIYYTFDEKHTILLSIKVIQGGVIWP